MKRTIASVLSVLLILITVTVAEASLSDYLSMPAGPDHKALWAKIALGVVGFGMVIFVSILLHRRRSHSQAMPWEPGFVSESARRQAQYYHDHPEKKQPDKSTD